MTDPGPEVGDIREIAASGVSDHQRKLISQEIVSISELRFDCIDDNPSSDVQVFQIERKPWMSYTAVTDTSSAQYELLQQATSDENGLMWIDGHVCVALGSKWGPVGSRYLFRMSTGDEIRVVKCDEKQDAHTAGGEGWTGADGHVMEMIVDTESLDEEAMLMGDCNGLIPGTVSEYIKT